MTHAAAAARSPSLVADLVTLTKPRIISLLLVTTVAPMFITPVGLPSLGLIGWVTLAGYLMAGGANTINMWFDRDIDDRMARTRLRPIPSGRLPAAAALLFGISLGAAAFTIFWVFVNPLSAWLALSGLLFYVFIYTIWLKRSSPQNIVIGGAAGAFPPLVGWAAMTNSIDLGALYLFAIIFYWTPPHFWALALNKQRDYGAAGVPMMPNVHGEVETKRQMLIYTLMLIPLTIMPVFVGVNGLLYGVIALALGARFIQLCWKIWREDGVTPTTWVLYKYSLVYLAVLFVAMAVDRVVPFGHFVPPSEHVFLRQGDTPAVPPAMNHEGH
jgi:protoheme IX farnesyltransferase